MPNRPGLRVCVVDNFQGEENEIILLSLVRSQEMTTKEKRDIRKLIGFLAIDNRICVSLSRAKKGFFCIGNLTLMRAANDLWSQILDEIEQADCIGKSLPLACQNHPTTITHVSNDSDFKKAPNGGCSVDCGARLDCGHRCEQLCHPTDLHHVEYKCRKRCTKKCKRGHPCIDLCFRDCSDCMVSVPKTIPNAIIKSEFLVIKILLLFSVLSHVQKSFVVAIHVQIHVENLVQQNAWQKFARLGHRAIIHVKRNVMLILRTLPAHNLVTVY